MSGDISTIALEPERKDFTKLIFGNPNYFGNIVGSNLLPVKPMNSNSSYEEIKCVGFNPDLNNLEAVVFIKRDFGYSGDICSSGSLEYVRFYLSYDGGKTWEDQGITSFKAFDIPGNKPLEYAVMLRINPKKFLCRIKNLPLVRAILSWNVQPPANTPNYHPAWGNVKEASIQISPIRFILLNELLNQVNTKALDSFNMVDGMQSINVMPPKILSVSELPALYKDKNVPEHRYLFPELNKQLSALHLNNTLMSATNLGVLSGLNVNVQDILKKLMLILGDTSYEELTCVGFDPIKNALVGIITVKKPYGFIGGLCEAGSKEFVAFWIDWGDGVWKWAGTTQVTVRDIDPMPAGGLQYAVYLPVDLINHIIPCTDGATIARVRATLSWEVAPPPANPNFVPTWGNRYETKIHVYPGKAVPKGDYTPFLQSICSIPICTIDQKTGFTKGDGPFGGYISIFGFIPGAPDVNTPLANRPRYRISVRPVGSSNWQHLNDTLSIYLDEQIGSGIPTSSHTNVPVDGDSYYTYNESSVVPGIGWRKINPPGLLAVWNSAGKTGLWEIMIESKDPVTSNVFSAGKFNCVEDNTTRQNVIIDLDQEAPKVSIRITDFDRNGINNPAKDCDTFQVGDIINGEYSVYDEHFGSLSLQVEPEVPLGNKAPIIPSSRSYPTVPTTGETGKWTLNTKDMKPCGYVVWIRASDRTIVNCSTNWSDQAFIGFCLGAKK